MLQQQQHRMKYKDRWVCKWTHHTSSREQSLQGHKSREHCEFHQHRAGASLQSRLGGNPGWFKLLPTPLLQVRSLFVQSQPALPCSHPTAGTLQLPRAALPPAHLQQCSHVLSQKYSTKTKRKSRTKLIALANEIRSQNTMCVLVFRRNFFLLYCT